MKLLGGVTRRLDALGIQYALVGAGAMAVHGVARSTFDLDLLVMDRACLQSETWADFLAAGILVDARPGGADDPLAGVVRFEETGARAVDLVVGRHAWQRRALERAVSVTLDERPVPVVQVRDLILLKLYAGGSQDAWDIQQLLTAVESQRLKADVEEDLSVLPPDCLAMWSVIVRR